MENHRAPKKMLDIIQMMRRGELPQPPVARLIGFRLTAIERGQAVVEFEAAEQPANPLGTLHGGILCDVADAAMGLVSRETTPPTAVAPSGR